MKLSLIVLGAGAAFITGIFIAASSTLKAAPHVWRRTTSGNLPAGRYRITVTGAPVNAALPKPQLAEKLVKQGWSDIVIYEEGDQLPADWPRDDTAGWSGVYRAELTAAAPLTVPDNVMVWT
jgi:hypothetical protein